MDAWIQQARRTLAPLGRRREGASAESTLETLVRSAPEDDPAEAELRGCTLLLLSVGRALLSYGLPAQRLENALTRLAHALGFEIDSFSTPTALVVSVGPAGEDRRTELIRVDPGEVDLERLSALHGLVGRVERRELSPADAGRRVRRVLERAPRHGELARVIAHAVTAAGGAVLLGGRLEDVPWALALGALTGVASQLARRFGLLARLLPALVAAVATLLAAALPLFGVPARELPLVLGAILVLLPGFTLTVATMELASAHVVSGTSRLVGGLSTLVQLGFGVALGHRLAEVIFPARPALDAVALPPEWAGWIAVAAVAIGLVVLLGAAPRDLVPVLGACAVAVVGSRLGRAWLGPEVGAFVGALALGVAGHLYARWRDRPALLLLTPGIILLVPGSVGFLSVHSMLESDTLTAMETGFRMLLIAMSLAAGVLVATVAVPPDRAL